MSHHARHRRPTNGSTASHTALTIAFTGATAAALPLLSTSSAHAELSRTNTVARTGPTAASGRADAREHVVRPGESLSGIAESLHLPGGWRALYADNRETVGPDPDLIRPGERLVVPVAASLRSVQARRASSATATPARAKTSAKTSAKAGPVPPTTARPAPRPAPAEPASFVSPRTTRPEGMPGTWTSVFDDEFNGHSLDAADWNTGWLAPGITAPVGSDEQACYAPSEVTVSGGYLHLDAVRRSEECGGRTLPYAAGMVTTAGLHQFTSGAFEARIYLPAAPDGAVANWPAFWTDGQVWPEDGEMDIMEGLEGKTCFRYHDAVSDTGGCADVGPGWHVFGANWEGGTVTYYYDGHDVGSTSAAGASPPQYIVLNNAVGGVGGPIATSAMLVDYVRVWKRG